jgi:formamidopyrimidine-DNA glycosylase
MPELPEMERYRIFLEQQLIDRTVRDIEINRDKSVNLDANDFIQQIKGQQITAVHRRAKHLIFLLTSGKQLLLHLMLGGWMYYGGDADSPDRTKQVILTLGDRKLYFIGLRLGYLHLLSEPELQERLEKLGPEPFSPQFESLAFTERLSFKKGSLKSVLVNQEFISGIGNCYSDEICFDAGIRPSVKADKVTGEQAAKLYHSIKFVLSSAIKLGGYMDHPMFKGDALTGTYNTHCYVYDREGEPCTRCGSVIVKVEISSKKSFYCPGCQYE